MATLHMLAIVQGFIRNQGDAWTWMLDLLMRGLSDLTTGGEDGAAMKSEQHEDYSAIAYTAGAAAGRNACSAVQDRRIIRISPRNAPMRKRCGSGKNRRCSSSPRHSRHSIARWNGRRRLPKISRQSSLRAGNWRIWCATLPLQAQGAVLTRIHGDLHLGQVLVANGDVYIIDFEGEPAKPMALRRAKNHRLRDVAGMHPLVRLRRGSDKRKSLPTQAHVADPHSRRISAKASSTGRLNVPCRLSRSLPGARTTQRSSQLLRLFLIEKAAYEIAYEAANRPTWIDVPLHGLAPNWSRRRHHERHGRHCRPAAGRGGGARQRRHAAIRSPCWVRSTPLLGRIVRAFLPGALEVEVLARADGRSLGRLAPTVTPPACSPVGSSSTEPYLLRITWPGAVQETEDPYSFGPLLGDLDLHLFNEGRHFELASHLGASVVTIDGVQRRAFRRLGAQRARGIGRRRFQYLGLAPASDAAALSGRRLGAVHSARRSRCALQVCRSSVRMGARLPLQGRSAGARDRTAACHRIRRRRSHAVRLAR